MHKERWSVDVCTSPTLKCLMKTTSVEGEFKEESKTSACSVIFRLLITISHKQAGLMVSPQTRNKALFVMSISLQIL